MKWSATMTIFAGSKTFSTPIFSICRNATGPLTSFAITTSQRTMTTSPGLTSSASQWASRIFSASVCASEHLQVRDHGVDGHNVAVLRVDVVEVRLVGRRVAIADRLARHRRAVAVLEGVDGGRADAARRRGAGDDDAVAAGRGEQAGERRAEKRRREQLVQDRLGRQRGDPRVDLDPPAPGLEGQERRDLVDERGGGDPVALAVRDGRVDDGKL